MISKLVRGAIRAFRRQHGLYRTQDVHYERDAEMLYQRDRSNHRRFAAAGAAGDRWRRRQDAIELARAITPVLR